MLELTPEDFDLLQKRAGEAVPEGLLPVGLEYRGPHGAISAFYCGRLTLRLPECEEAAALGGVRGVQLHENEDRTWQLRLCGADPEHAALGTATEETMQALLRRFNLLPLPGMEP